MKKKKLATVGFAPHVKDSFFEKVVKKVDIYFQKSKTSQYATPGMWAKTIVMMLLYFMPYGLIVSGFGAVNGWLFYGLWVMMSIGMIGIGTSVMHDANHGTYSPKRKVNDFISRILEIIGGYTITWRIQHNVLHHTYTNITGLDEDLDAIKFLRFSPRQPWLPIHRYQYLYAWFFYMMMTLFWMTAKDYIQIIRYKQHDLLKQQNVTFRQAIFKITLYKVIYYAYIIVLPILFSGMPWYHVVLGFLVMHFIAGLVLSCVFQPSHIVETSGFALPVQENGNRRMKDAWAIHEVANTTDFAPRSAFLNWFIGGLNFQIEHHLFTGICHVHYRKLAPIVKSTCKEFGIPYHVEPTFFSALAGHMRMLRLLGKKATGH